jgi:hypothetical protein
MNLRCVFHVSPASTVQPKAEQRERLPSTESPVDLAAIEAQAKPRGRSFETWSRARGWASED